LCCFVLFIPRKFISFNKTNTGSLSFAFSFYVNVFSKSSPNIYIFINLFIYFIFVIIMCNKYYVCLPFENKTLIFKVSITCSSKLNKQKHSSFIFLSYQQSLTSSTCFCYVLCVMIMMIT
jgi:hypothetical protein